MNPKAALIKGVKISNGSLNLTHLYEASQKLPLKRCVTSIASHTLTNFMNPHKRSVGTSKLGLS